ncbi:hypothetical protein PAEPH01_2326, partial [Pancytospora epiphaga]
GFHAIMILQNQMIKVQFKNQNKLLENKEENDWYNKLKLKVLCERCKKITPACLISKLPSPINTNEDYIPADVYPTCIVCKPINPSDTYHLCRKRFKFTTLLERNVCYV